MLCTVINAQFPTEIPVTTLSVLVNGMRGTNVKGRMLFPQIRRISWFVILRSISDVDLTVQLVLLLLSCLGDLEGAEHFLCG